MGFCPRYVPAGEQNALRRPPGSYVGPSTATSARSRRGYLGSGQPTKKSIQIVFEDQSSTPLFLVRKCFCAISS